MAAQAIQVQVLYKIRTLVCALGILAIAVFAAETMAAPFNLAPDGNPFLGVGVDTTG